MTKIIALITEEFKYTEHQYAEVILYVVNEELFSKELLNVKDVKTALKIIFNNQQALKIAKIYCKNVTISEHRYDTGKLIIDCWQDNSHICSNSVVDLIIKN